jgi:hypothetical protein
MSDENSPIRSDTFHEQVGVQIFEGDFRLYLNS